MDIIEMGVAAVSVAKEVLGLAEAASSDILKSAEREKADLLEQERVLRDETNALKAERTGRLIGQAAKAVAQEVIRRSIFKA